MIEINTVIEMMLNHHEVFKMQHRSLKLSFNLQMARSIVLLEKQMHLPQQNFVFGLTSNSLYIIQKVHPLFYLGDLLEGR